MREPVVVYLKGICMGAADAVPGISGGTIALIVGIYERLVSAVAAVDPGVVPALLQPWDPDARAEVMAMIRAMDLPFLLPLGAGIISAVVIATRGLDYLLEVAPAATYAFFFGLIAAATIVLYSEVSFDTLRHRAVAMSGFLLAFGVSGLSESALPASLPVLFGAGAIAVSAMVLPGISGSLLLIILGQYEHMVGALKEFTDGLAGYVGSGPTSGVRRAGPDVVVFVLGAGVGLLSVAKAIRFALDRYRAATLTFLVALMVGALRTPIDEIRTAETAWTPTMTGLVIGAGIGGAFVVLALAAATDDLEY